MPKYNIALLCNDIKHSEALCEFSQSLASISPSQYILGVNSYPHLSVCHFYAEESELEDIWKQAKAFIEFSVTLIKPFWCIAESDSNYAYTVIETSKPKELELLQEKLVKMIGEENITNGYADKFFPHFTVCYNDTNDKNNVLSTINADAWIWQQKIPFKLVLGEFGTHGRLEKIIFQ